MRIWIDGDACPVAVRDIVIRAAVRRQIPVVFVANNQLVLPDSEHVSFVKVEAGPDLADRYIQENARSSDLVVTQDIPLAHLLVSTGIVVINPRGEVYSENNIGDRLSMRNLCQELRDSGEVSGGPKQFGEKEKKAFASSFDRELTRLFRKLPR
jgi:uncharacterized protein